MNFWVEVYVKAQDDFVPDYVEQEFDLKEYLVETHEIMHGVSKIGFTGGCISSESIQDEIKKLITVIFGK